MKKIYKIVAVLCLLVSGVYFYLGLETGDTDEAMAEIRRAMRTQVKLMIREVNGIAKEMDTQLHTFTKTRQASKYSFLMGAKAPSYVLLLTKGKEKKFAAPKLPKDSATSIHQALRAHLHSGPPMAYYEDARKKSYILLKGLIKKVQYGAAFPQASFFRSLKNRGFISPWVITRDGTFLYHSSPRFVGKDAAWIRPVALSEESLSTRQRTEMVAEYKSFDGKEALGAWITSPKLGVIVGLEWPWSWSGKKKSASILWIAIGSLFMGSLCLGLALRSSRTASVMAQDRPKEDDKEESNIVLGHEAEKFIRRAERSAELSAKYAKEKEEKYLELEGRAREKIAHAERVRWVFDQTNHFLDAVMNTEEEQDVWRILARSLSSMAMHVPVAIYQYSSTTCSLFPVATAGVEELNEEASQFFGDARIMIGGSRHIANIHKTKAFQAWHERCEKYVSLENTDILSIPFKSSSGSQGVAIFLLDKEAMLGVELQQQQKLWNLFCYRAAWLYDMKRRLIQFKHEHGSRKISTSTLDSIGSAPSKFEEKLPPTV